VPERRTPDEIDETADRITARAKELAELSAEHRREAIVNGNPELADRERRIADVQAAAVDSMERTEDTLHRAAQLERDLRKNEDGGR
jgi:hypothetical protein